MIITPQLFSFLESLDLHKMIPMMDTQRNIIDNHGDYFQWKQILEKLPALKPSNIDLNCPAVSIGQKSEISETDSENVLYALKALHPWRKGPFNLFGHFIDAEWRSDFKWNRLVKHIGSLKGKKILDVGCGNGYYGWRMLGAGARAVVGVEPYLLSIMQFTAFKKYIPDSPFFILPVGVEKMPQNLKSFDTVFSMGVFYHRRSPLDHLIELKSFLTNRAKLVLETLVINGKTGEVLVPEGRYAKMRNVWFIPSPGTMEAWLKKAGFINVRCADIMRITTDEQRRTDWMKWESLPDFLNPQDAAYTIEGLPAPVRAIFLAEKP